MDSTQTAHASAITQGGFKFQPYLEGLRGVAILLVMVAHLIPVIGGLSVVKWGGLGVNIFFVLSGFLITSILVAEERRTGSISLKQFYLRRVFRIFPVFYLFVLFVGLLKLTGVSPDPARDLLISGLFLRNIFGHGDFTGHLWSVSLEEQFYFLWPLSLLLLGYRRILSKALGVIFLVMVWRAVAIHWSLFNYDSGVFNVRTDFRIDAILIGCVTSLAFHSAKFRPWLEKISQSWLTPFAFLAMLYWTLNGESFTKPFYHTVNNFLTAYFFLCLVCHERSLSRTTLCTSGLRWIGKVSYSLYLWHLCIVPIETLHALPLIVQIGLAFLMATISYYGVEMPCLKLKERWATSVGKEQDLQNLGTLRPRLTTLVSQSTEDTATLAVDAART